jgi:hypothetical protein
MLGLTPSHLGDLNMRTTSIPATARRIALSLLAATTLGACSADAPTAPAMRPTAHLAAVEGSEAPGCHPDSKLIGRIQLSTADTPGTWWYITREGFDAAGITDYQGFIEYAFGLTFATLDEAIAHLVNAVTPWDENGNGYVCAYAARGTRTNYALPDVSRYIFGTTDDDHRAK